MSNENQKTEAKGMPNLRGGGVEKLILNLWKDRSFYITDPLSFSTLFSLSWLCRGGLK
jgi:hypothetical protein